MKKNKNKVGNKPKNKHMSKAKVGSSSASRIGVTPLGDRVIVEPLAKEKMLASGIIIPDTADKERPDQGVVVAVGMGKRDDSGRLVPVSVRVGDKVMFSKYGPDEIKIGDKEYYVVSESNILAILS